MLCELKRRDSREIRRVLRVARRLVDHEGYRSKIEVTAYPVSVAA